MRTLLYATGLVAALALAGCSTADPAADLAQTASANADGMAEYIAAIDTCGVDRADVEASSTDTPGISLLVGDGSHAITKAALWCILEDLGLPRTPNEAAISKELKDDSGSADLPWPGHHLFWFDSLAENAEPAQVHLVTVE